VGLARGAGGVRLKAVMKNDFRARSHPAYWAFIVHRASGLLLAIFLPFHFWALGQALQGAEALDGFLHWTAQPLVKFAEIGLVLLLAAHMAGGVRLLMLEFLAWRDWQKTLLAIAAGVSLAAGLAFALNVV
jgi:fumarate reductase subunit D